ncbi:serum amyloid P-component-like [Acanthopagrus latus]|uniref:serum amyloid P-component-like n=1 Tax=Acanthopagrus latus TaxID=8177 RepID=UPI00187CDA1A|nr:serum amyloid P-component-like [Acanthopagrus latus]XP_036931787.1 serum amyloid P-component-like [Acanthopagrus latus]
MFVFNTSQPDTGFKMVLMLLAMLTVCSAVPQDLYGKMFIFPQETNTAHVRLTTSRQDLRNVTVCLRSFTDLRRGHSLFSLATPSVDNDFQIYKDDAHDQMNLHVRNHYVYFAGQNYKLNTWHSLCSTWDSASGLAQLWLDGKPSSWKLSSKSSINGPIIIVLGQEQDTHGGGFVLMESFAGMLSDVHMWDYTISPCEIQNYMDDLSFPPGNVLNWRALEFQIIGTVLIGDKQKSCY